MPLKKTNSLIDESSGDSNVEYITNIIVRPEIVHTVTQATYPKEIYTEMVVKKRHMKFQVDSGASVNIIRSGLSQITTSKEPQRHCKCGTRQL